MLKVYDISAPIYPGMPVYKNKAEKQPRLDTVRNGYVTESRLNIDLHCGTHVDAPLHMFPDGEGTESLAVSQLVTPCKVLDLQHVRSKIMQRDLEGRGLGKGDFILCQTRNSMEENFNFEFVYLSEEGASYLAQIGVKGVGIDALGIERDQVGHPTHKVLLGNRIMVIEGLRLGEVPAGEYLMIVAPLKLLGGEASPARVLLLPAYQSHCV